MEHLAPETGPLHRLFEASLLAKGFLAAIESCAGLALLLTSAASVRRDIDWLAERELIEAVSGPVASRVLDAARAITPDTLHFYALYLLSHGAVKLLTVTLLARRIAAAYPIAIVVFAAFIAYQLHRWHVSGSPLMLALSAFDTLVIWLIWREWHGEDHAPAA